MTIATGKCLLIFQIRLKKEEKKPRPSCKLLKKLPENQVIKFIWPNVVEIQKELFNICMFYVIIMMMRYWNLVTCVQTLECYTTICELFSHFLQLDDQYTWWVTVAVSVASLNEQYEVAAIYTFVYETNHAIQH